MREEALLRAVREAGVAEADLREMAAHFAALAPEGSADEALARLHREDLVVVHKAMRGVGVDALLRRVRDTVARAIARVRGLHDAEGLLDRLVVDFFTGKEGAAPLLARYAGLGTLDAFVQVTASRAALTQHRDEGRQRETGLDEFDLLDSEDMELDFIRSQYREAFRNAFASALAELTPKERNLLRYQVKDGLTLDELARLHRVHRATVARWLADARSTVLSATRRILHEQLRLDESEFESLLRVIGGHFELSVVSLLERADATAA